jgi:hypothetical protein
VWSAFRVGGCRLVVWRSSRRALGGRAAEAFFGSSASAFAFARRWSARVGVAVRVRRSRGGWSVAVPVAAWVSLGHGAVVVAGRGGGVRGVASGLAASRAVGGFGV